MRLYTDCGRKHRCLYLIEFIYHGDSKYSHQIPECWRFWSKSRVVSVIGLNDKCQTVLHSQIACMYRSIIHHRDLKSHNTFYTARVCAYNTFKMCTNCFQNWSLLIDFRITLLVGLNDKCQTVLHSQIACMYHSIIHHRDLKSHNTFYTARVCAYNTFKMCTNCFQNLSLLIDFRITLLVGLNDKCQTVLHSQIACRYHSIIHHRDLKSHNTFYTATRSKCAQIVFKNWVYSLILESHWEMHSNKYKHAQYWVLVILRSRVELENFLEGENSYDRMLRGKKKPQYL